VRFITSCFFLAPVGGLETAPLPIVEKKMKFKTGTAYRIKFIDHSIGDKKPDTFSYCETFGVVESENETILTINYWILFNEDEDIVKENLERVTIIKTSIVNWVKIPDYKRKDKDLK
jgi:hypothetical protein